MNRNFIVLFIWATVLVGCTSVKPVAYLCAYMTGEDERHLYYAVSGKKFCFEPVNGGLPVLESSLDDGLLRDPHIFRDQKGIYHLSATVSWKNRPFVMWDSRDLIHWENERLIDVAPANATKTWAPELAYDEEGKRYFAYWTADIGGDFNTAAIYYATTTDFQRFSEPRMLYSETDGGILDANILHAGNTYYMFYRYKKKIWVVTSQHATGPYGHRKLVVDANVEGPFAFRLNDHSGYALVWDYYGGSKGFGLAVSSDMNQWQTKTNHRHPYYNDSVCFPKGIRHGSVIGVTRKQLKNITKR